MDEPVDAYQIEEYQLAVLKQRSALLKIFIPGKKEETPFPQQVSFLRDASLSKIARCGNRAAKTFTCMRDLAWKITRTHWYRQDYNVFNIRSKNWMDKLSSPEFEELYLSSKPQVFWIVAPTYDFINLTMWELYLVKMIPAWFIADIKRTNQGNLETIVFRNGDVIKCKTYAQRDTTKMGAVVNGVYLDEMPPDQQTMTELVVRTFDLDGQFTCGFTSLVTNEEIRKYVDSACASGAMSLHQWSILDNPWYSNNPERMERVLAEYENLPENEKAARLNGDWYYEMAEKSVFEGIQPETVEDFMVPISWRRCRFTDPASHVTGHAEFAEDPATGIWYCYKGVEISWGKIAKASDIIEVIEGLKPSRDYRYLMSVYDNAEAWFGAEAVHLGYRACLLKNREAAIMHTRNAVGGGKVKFFKNAANELLLQMAGYHLNKAGTGVVKKNDHILDCLMYFCREIPEPLPAPTTQQSIHQEMIAKSIQETINPRPLLPPKFARNKFRAGLHEYKRQFARGVR